MRKYGLAVTTLAVVLGLPAPVGHVRRASANPHYIVSTTDDSTYDGTCDASHCTLREAITLANSHAGDDYIHIIIPDDDPGCDGVVCTITLSSTYGALPPLNDMSGGTFVNGTSQPETNPDGPEIVINGSGSYDCFKIWSRYNTITGFVINECVHGVTICDVGPPWDPGYNTISGNYIGIDYEGTAAAGNTQGGIQIIGAHDNTIGGTTAQKRNIISGNVYYGVEIWGDDAHHNKVVGNYVGTNADGTGAVPNDWNGISILEEAHDNMIGGLTSGERNVISGNQTGIAIEADACYNRIIGNYIGTALNGLDAVPNSIGVFMGNAAHHNYTGGTIAYNTNWGVRVDGAASIGNTITAHPIHSNGDLGIYLTNGGNGGILPPSITTPSCNSAGGTALVGRTIRVFSDYDGQGRQFHGEDQVSGGGTWMVTLPSGMFTYPNLTATATDTSGNTSEFSAPVRNGCEFLWMPLSLKRY